MVWPFVTPAVLAVAVGIGHVMSSRLRPLPSWYRALQAFFVFLLLVPAFIIIQDQMLTAMGTVPYAAVRRTVVGMLVVVVLAWIGGHTIMRGGIPIMVGVAFAVGALLLANSMPDAAALLAAFALFPIAAGLATQPLRPAANGAVAVAGLVVLATATIVVAPVVFFSFALGAEVQPATYEWEATWTQSAGTEILRLPIPVFPVAADTPESNPDPEAVRLWRQAIEAQTDGRLDGDILVLSGDAAQMGELRVTLDLSDKVAVFPQRPGASGQVTLEGNQPLDVTWHLRADAGPWDCGLDATWQASLRPGRPATLEGTWPATDDDNGAPPVWCAIG